MGKYRTYDAELKARVVLEALQGQKTAAQICRENGIADDLLAHWKREFVERASELFRTRQERSTDEARIAELERLVGQLTLELAAAKSLQSAELSVEQRRQIVNQHAAEFSRERLCAMLDLPRSTLYYQAQPAEDLDLRSALEPVALEFPRYGYRRMTAELQRRGWAVNHKRVLRLMREAHLLVQVRRFCRTTFSHHPYGRYPNLIKHLLIERPDQVWCGDITYIRLQHEFVYLAVLLDIFTRSVRGWELSRQLGQELPKAALQRALRSARPEIHHSDQGVQYAADGYTELLRAAGVQISMSAQGQPIENAYAERFMRTRKEEEVYLHEYQDFADARQHIGRFLEDVYMHKRVHSALGYLPLAEFEMLWRATEERTMQPALGAAGAVFEAAPAASKALAAEPSTLATKEIS